MTIWDIITIFFLTYELQATQTQTNSDTDTLRICASRYHSYTVFMTPFSWTFLKVNPYVIENRRNFNWLYNFDSVAHGIFITVRLDLCFVVSRHLLTAASMLSILAPLGLFHSVRAILQGKP